MDGITIEKDHVERRKEKRVDDEWFTSSGKQDDFFDIVCVPYEIPRSEASGFGENEMCKKERPRVS